MLKKKKQKKLLGRSEKVDLPELGLWDVEAKIDSGAFTCSIHCHKIEIAKRNGEKLLHFVPLAPSHSSHASEGFYFLKYTEKMVKNSFGDAEKRFIISTPVILYNQMIETEFSLSFRENLRYPILIGRKLLSKKFLIDVSKKNISYKFKKKQNENSGSVKKS